MYGGVRSKVARNIKVKDKVVKKEKRAKVRAQQSDFIEANASSPEERMAITIKKENEQLSVRQLGMTFHQKDTPWQKVHDEKLRETDRLIREQEAQIEALQREIEAKRELRQSQSPTKYSQLKATSPTFHQQVLEQSPPNRHLEDVITNLPVEEDSEYDGAASQHAQDLNESPNIQLGATITSTVNAQAQLQAQLDIKVPQVQQKQQ